MTILVRKALIVDPQSPHHNLIKDILVNDGFIEDIGDDISTDNATLIQFENLMVSPGWIDIFANFCDPGNEQKETIETGSVAAIAGGFTQVCVIPNTNPVIDSKAQVEYIIQKARDLLVTIHPLGAISKACQGKELAEMYDMKNSGAAAFSDGTYPVQSPGLLLKALQYVKTFDGTIIQVPNDKSLSAHGQMNEGITSTRLGLPGIPCLAEELIIKRDIDLARYTESNIHFTGVSTAKSLELIKQAKQEGLGVTCSVTPYHLAFSEEDVAGYNTNYKVSPPLRTKADVKALQDELLRGTIDCIATHHFPQHWDNKECEFEYAKDGMLGLESCFQLINQTLPELSNEQLVSLLSTNASKLLNLPSPGIKKDAVAELTLFSREGSFMFTASDIKSKSANTPLIGKELKGKVIGIINKGHLFLN